MPHATSCSLLPHTLPVWPLATLTRPSLHSTAPVQAENYNAQQGRGILQPKQQPAQGSKTSNSSPSDATAFLAPSSPGVRAVGLALGPGDLWGLAAAGEAAGRLEAECHDALSRMGAFLSVVSRGGCSAVRWVVPTGTVGGGAPS